MRKTPTAVAAAPEGELGGHHRDAEDEYAEYVDQKEEGAPVGLDLGRKTPHIAQPDGRTDRGCDDTDF